MKIKQYMNEVDNIEKAFQLFAKLNATVRKCKGGRRFTSEDYENSLSLNDLVMKAQTLKSNSVDDEKYKKLIKRIKTLDSQADEKLSDQGKLIKIFTAVRSFFGHWFHDERAVLQDLEKDVLRVESGKVFKKKTENLLIDVSKSEVMKLQNKIEITNPNHSKVKLKDAEKSKRGRFVKN